MKLKQSEVKLKNMQNKIRVNEQNMCDVCEYMVTSKSKFEEHMQRFHICKKDKVLESISFYICDP